MSIDKIEGIKKVSKAIKSAEQVNRPDAAGANKDHFESLMLQQSKKKEATTVTQTEEMTKKPSLMEQVSNLNNKVNRISNISPQDLVAQAKDVIGKIDDLKTKLSTPNLEIKGSVQSLLKNKLTHIDENLRIALNRAGVEYKVPEKPATGEVVNPIERFLGYLTDGQYQLAHLSDEIEAMQQKKGELSPASMLAIQVKVGFVTQEVEFFTSLLQQALSSTKTIMNVQV